MFWVPRILVWLGALYLVIRAGLWAWVAILPTNPHRGYAAFAAFALLLLVALLRVWKLPRNRPITWQFLVLSGAMLIDSWAFEKYTLMVMSQQ